jgi:putative PIG3 family NAD(P)H quinone oxidoreductase
MRAVLAIRPGGPEVLEVCDVSKPSLQPGQVLIQIAASALNRADLLQCRGLYPPPPGVTDVLGLECSGTVIEASGKEAEMWLGKRVMTLLPGGGYAEYAVTSCRLCLEVPATLDLLEAAAIPEAFLTAQEALFTQGALQAGERVFIQAGASGVGSAALQMAVAHGATAFASAGSDAKCEHIRALGGHAINRHSAPWEEELAQLAEQQTGKAQMDVILDVVGGSALANHLNLLAPGGRLVVVGLLGGSRATLDLGMLLQKRLKLAGLVMRSRSEADKIAMTRRFERDWLPRFGSQLRPFVDSVYTLDQVRAAHEHMSNNRNAGKILLTL